MSDAPRDTSPGVDGPGDPDERAFLHTSCAGTASVIPTVALLVDDDGSRSMRGQCGEP